MARRVRESRVLKWAKENKLVVAGGVSVPSALLLIGFLLSLGVINIIDYSKDMGCNGTPDDLCVASVIFEAKEDIFIYPSDSWGLTVDKPIKNLKMYRTWGSTATLDSVKKGETKGLREIKLTETCKGTWCGGKKGTTDNAYSFAFRKGRTYTIYYTAEKYYPSDVIKWSFGFDGDIYADPFWYPQNLTSIELRNMVEYNNWSTYANMTYINQSCVWNSTNSSWSPCPYNVTIETNHSEIIKQWQELQIDSAVRNVTDWNVWCWDNQVDMITCKSTLDGDGEFKQEGLKDGMSYFWINYTVPPVVFYTEDYYGDYYLGQLEAMVNE